MEPTHKQHLLLKRIYRDGYHEKTGKQKDIELYWELVRAGYLQNLVTIFGRYEWVFKLTDKALKYLGKE